MNDPKTPKIIWYVDNLGMDAPSRERTRLTGDATNQDGARFTFSLPFVPGSVPEGEPLDPHEAVVATFKAHGINLVNLQRWETP